MVISGLQINVNHALAAHNYLLQFGLENKYDFLCLQEPYVSNDKVLSPPFGLKIFSSTSNKASIIILNPDLHTVLKFTSSSCVVVEILLPNASVFNLISIYCPPHDAIDSNLTEMLPLDFVNSDYLILGDFNARARMWGYEFIDRRGHSVIDFCMKNNLVILNEPTCGPTFVSHSGKGYPDLTMVSFGLFDRILNWELLSSDSFSDHKFIKITLNFELPTSSSFCFKTNFSLGKFIHYFRPFVSPLSTLFDDVSDSASLNSATLSLVDLVKSGALKNIRKKKVSNRPKLSWWNPELAKFRNFVNALSKRIKALERNGASHPIIDEAKIKYKLNRAKYKTLIYQAKTRAWKNFCSNCSSKFGTHFKFAFQKVNKINNINLQFSDNINLSYNDKIKRLLDHFFKTDATFDTFPQMDLPVEGMGNVTEEELALVINHLPNGKAPGLDLLDFNIWKSIFKSFPSLLTKFANACFKLCTFPDCLKNAKILFFNKPGKDPSECSAYRPICLLPTIGKIIEKLFVNRLNFWLNTTGTLHPHQFGFREGLSCELAAHKLVKHIERHRPGHHVSLTTVDVCGAFDNLNWNVLPTILEKINLPHALQSFIYSYLKHRTITFQDNDVICTRTISMGAPQGSVISPILWNIYFNQILSLNNDHYYLQAFADDLAVVTYASEISILRRDTNYILSRVSSVLSSLKLSASPQKSQCIIFYRPNYLRCRGHAFFLDGVRIKTTNFLSYLGILIDNKLTWSSHILYLKEKCLKLSSNFGKLIGSNWGVNKYFLKLWYHTVIEKIITYGCGVWGKHLSRDQVTRLTSIQRIFLLKISSGFRTSSGISLYSVTGIPPVHHVVNVLYKKFNFWTIKCDSFNDPSLPPPSSFDCPFPVSSIHPSLRTANLSSVNPVLFSDINIYTDGSKFNENVGLSVCIFVRDDLEDVFTFKLGNGNSVFQAELAAIGFAINWASKNNVKVNIFSDSLSSILALNSVKNNSSFLWEIKSLAQNFKHLINLTWVKAHCGNLGNETADYHAKLATNTGTRMMIPLPYSFLTKYCKDLINKYWQTQLNNYISPRTHDPSRVLNFLPSVNPSFQIFNKFLIYFVTGHGPFLDYLHYFKFKSSSRCKCGAYGDADHFIFDCPFTLVHHLVKPAAANRPTWFAEICRNKTLTEKIKHCILIAREISNDIT